MLLNKGYIGLVSSAESHLKSSNVSNGAKNSQSFFQEIFKIKLLFVSAALILSFFLYLATLKGCSSHSEMGCLVEMVPMIPEMCFCVLLVTLIIDGVLFLSLKHAIPKASAYLAIIEIIIVVVISNGHSWQNHGGYNRLFFIFFLILNLVTINVLGTIYKIFKKYPKVTTSTVIILSVSLYLLIVVYWFGRSCRSWDVGMKNTRISKENCELPEPKVCFYDLTNNWFDLSSLLNKNDCSKVRNNIPILQEPADFIAYPKTQHFLRYEKNFEVYQKNILAQMKKINESQINDERHEVVLDQRNDEKKILINVFRNESLIKRSQTILNNPDSPRPIAQNILMVFIDSVSRQHFARKLSKTYEWLENHYQNKTSPHESFQFFKYHTSAAHTVPNMMRIFYGTDYDHANNSYPLSLKFKKQGYITAKSNNYCGSTFFDVSITEPELQGLNMESADHENTALFCDPNYQKMNKDGSYGYMEGSFAMVRRCLYGKDTYDHVLDYGNKFWHTYQEMPKVLEIGFMDGHEPSNELLQYLDMPLYNFFSGLERENLLQDTAIVFYADHGHHVNIFYHLFQLKDLQYELRLPMIFMIVSRNLADKYRDSLKSYEQNIVTAYDIYNSFSFLSGDSQFRGDGVNLFEKREKHRCCSDLDLEKDFCICKCKCENN